MPLSLRLYNHLLVALFLETASDNSNDISLVHPPYKDIEYLSDHKGHESCALGPVDAILDAYLVTGIWVEGNENITTYKRSIIVYGRSEYPTQIHAYFACYDPLAYPMFFPNSEARWHKRILRAGVDIRELVDDDDNNGAEDEEGYEAMVFVTAGFVEGHLPPPMVFNDHTKDPPCMQPDDVEEAAIAGMKPTPTRVNSGTFYNYGLNDTKQKEKGTGATSWWIKGYYVQLYQHLIARKYINM
nr:hypothetical protein [Tanacetum cinerariifolium]